jgi:predicted AlkP superfamily pyrophosphatase or phosphodiesterase
MYKTLKNIIVAVTSILMILMAYPTFSADYPNLVIMGWDGAGLRNVQLLMEKEKLPNLKRLIQKNKRITLIPTPLHGRTCTIPMWTEFFTGLTWDQTGVFGNRKLTSAKQPIELKSFNIANRIYSGVSFWAVELPSDWCFVNDLKKLGYEVGWFTSKYYVSNKCSASPLCHCAELADTNLAVPPDPLNPDSYLPTLTDAAINFMLSARQPFMVFLHVDPDWYGHHYGENSDRYLEEFERADNVLGQLIDLMVGTNTKFLVVADHGFDENGDQHYNAPDSWMAGNMPLHRAYWLDDGQKAFGSLIDWRPTLLEFLRIDWKEYTPMLRGKSLLDADVIDQALR